MHTALLELSPPLLPDVERVMGRADGENFPVAARVLGRRARRHLLAVYGFARLVDELGDEYVGERLAALDWLEGELDRAYAGQARHPLVRRLQPTLTECALPRATLVRLIEANRLDQRVTRYETWEQLRAYCELSANPVGELVLRVFGLWSPERVSLSDNVCTALQLVEHLQDVEQDRRRGRVYLPAEDSERCGGLRETVAFEVGRARELLSAGPVLVASVPTGRPKLALAAFVAGGRAALETIERADFDVLRGFERASPLRRARALASVLLEGRRA